MQDDETENCISEDYLCDTCDKIFNESDHFLTHSVKEHGFQAEELGYDCGNCFKSFAKISLFRKHLKIISKKENILVSNYEVAVAVKADVQQHSKKCEICGKTLSAQYLKVHILTVHNQEGNNVHSCQICKKNFKEKYALNKHIKRVHIQKKQSKCKNCGKSFYQNYLKLHISTVHEGARKFECKHCNTKFSQKASLTFHIKNSITKSECEICGKSFCSDYTLRMHMKIVHKQ